MRRFGLNLLSLVLLVVWVWPVSLQAAPAFWKVTDPAAQNTDGTVYLFGSFHLLKSSDQWLTEQVANRFAASDRLVLETAADQLQPEVMRELVGRHGVYPPGLRLSDRVPTDLMVRLDSVMSSLGSSGAAMEQFRPWYVALVAGVQFAQSLGFRPEEGVEEFFISHARKLERPVQGLETAEEQLSFFFTKEETIQIRFLEDTLRQIEDTPAILTDLVEAWKAGDLEKMDRLVISAMRQVPEVYDALLVRRNMNWRDRLIELTRAEGSSFVVVGAAHLVGDDSLVRMLRDRGLRVERIN